MYACVCVRYIKNDEKCYDKNQSICPYVELYQINDCHWEFQIVFEFQGTYVFFTQEIKSANFITNE